MKKILSKENISNYLGVLIIACIVFVDTYNRNINTDIWFHLASGKVFAMNHGPIFHDVFSFSAYGRSIVPYEWLFQVCIYIYAKMFGLQRVGLLVAFFSIIQVIIIYFLLQKIFSLNKVFTFSLSLLYFFGIADSLIARPAIISNIFFLLITFVVLLYIYKNKNFLWISIPIVLIWSNLHASFILQAGLLGEYSFVCFIYGLFYKESNFLHKGKILAMYAISSLILPVLPPLYGSQYRLLWSFIHYRDIVLTINEWRPLMAYGNLFIGYSMTFALFVCGFLYVARKQGVRQMLLLLPWFIFLVSPYLAIRNFLYSILAVVICLAFLISVIISEQKKKIVSLVFLIILIGFLIISRITTYTYAAGNSEDYPEAAATFILTHHLQGNMFNNYKYGAYLLYRLFPQQRVFIDGRADIYLCCELPLLYTLNVEDQDNKTEEFRKGLYDLFNKYHISFVITTRERLLEQKTIQLLANDPTWSLVFWDDNSQIFVKKDGENDQVIKQFGAIAATPYGKKNTYDPTQLDQAIYEYQRMIHVADSGKSENILGTLYLQKHEKDLAKKAFARAIQVNTLYFPPYINLAEISIADKDYDTAIHTYQQLMTIDPTTAQSYIRLGQIYAGVYQDMGKAKNIWNNGLQNVTDEKAKQVLQNLIISAN